jgi:hypothetical protein
MLKNYHEMMAEDMGDERGVLVFDETGFPRRGKIRQGWPGSIAGLPVK